MEVHTDIIRSWLKVYGPHTKFTWAFGFETKWPVKVWGPCKLRAYIVNYRSSTDPKLYVPILADFQTNHMEIFKILSTYPFDIYNGIQQTFWTIGIFESALLQKYRNKNIWTAIIRCIGFYFEKMQMYMKKQTSQMRLFVLDTVYVWRYKFQKDIHHRHLISKNFSNWKFQVDSFHKIFRRWWGHLIEVPEIC